MKKIDPKMRSLLNVKRRWRPPFKKSPERIVPGISPPFEVQMHMARYKFAIEEGLVDGKTVLDLCCGAGYGSEILAEKASKVIGVDASRDAVEFAKQNYKRKNIEFMEMDARRLGLGDESVDVVCAFEALEHLKKPYEMMGEIRRVLKKGGIAVISTPNRYLSSPFSKKPLNPHHLKEYLPNEFLDNLGKYFKVEGLYGQVIFSRGRAYRHAVAKSFLANFGLLTPARNLRDMFLKRKPAGRGVPPETAVKKIQANGSHQPTYMVAVCRKE